MNHWYDDQNDLNEFAAYLHDEGELTTAEEVLRFFEKPWKWSRDFDAYQLTKKLAAEGQIKP